MLSKWTNSQQIKILLVYQQRLYCAMPEHIQYVDDRMNYFRNFKSFILVYCFISFLHYTWVVYMYAWYTKRLLFFLLLSVFRSKTQFFFCCYLIYGNAIGIYSALLGYSFS